MIDFNKDFMEVARGIAKQLDTPEMRELYRKQKLADDTLDDRVDELTKELTDDLEDDLKHDKDS